MNSIKHTLFGVGDNIESGLDLNQHLIRHPAATFFTRAAGHSMPDMGLLDGDLLIVDRSITPSNNAIVIAVINGALTVKRLKLVGKQAFLYTPNQNSQAIFMNNTDLELWGVVTYAIHDLRPS